MTNIKMKKYIISGISVLLCIMISMISFAQEQEEPKTIKTGNIPVADPAHVPNKLNYQGYLIDSSGNPVNGARSVNYHRQRRWLVGLLSPRRGRTQSF